jgi:hypothetical protein
LAGGGLASRRRDASSLTAGAPSLDGRVSVTRVGRLTPPTEAASIASIWFRNFWLTEVGGDRVFSEPTPSLSHLDQERPILGIWCRARLLKTSRRIALIIFYGAHFPRNRADLRRQLRDTGAGSENLERTRPAKRPLARRHGLAVWRSASIGGLAVIDHSLRLA